jgi:hypothetical protein
MINIINWFANEKGNKVNHVVFNLQMSKNFTLYKFVSLSNHYDELPYGHLPKCFAFIGNRRFAQSDKGKKLG